MASIGDEFLRGQLLERRARLESALATGNQDVVLSRLLRDVDAALERMKNGTYGLCESCHEPVEARRLMADPLVRFCLDHLNTAQQRALEEDLELAARIQGSLLPPPHVAHANWQVHYRYQPAGPVSGDYCDVIVPEDGAQGLTFLLGDVSGKGVAASMIMSQLHAMFRSLTSVGLPLGQLLARANRIFCESNIAGQYATLVCGRAGHAGEVELASAGHCPALHVRRGAIDPVRATGVPLGLFCDGQFAVRKLRLEPGESLVLYTDGLSEARNASGDEYGEERLTESVGRATALAPEQFADACLADWKQFVAGTPPTDDLSFMILRCRP